uniref:Uncharacterized protein n=1 Tax=Arundo donax TaxID=35708 RepID=A0A0A8ZLL0_ARUDO
MRFAPKPLSCKLSGSHGTCNFSMLPAGWSPF